MWPCHLAPDDADLGAAHLLLTPVDIRDLLAQVEAASFVNDGPPARWDPSLRDVLGTRGVIDALNLDEARLGVGVVAATLVAQVATPITQSPSVSFDSIHGRFRAAHRVAWVHSRSGLQLGAIGGVAGFCTHLTYTRRHS